MKLDNLIKETSVTYNLSLDRIKTLKIKASLLLAGFKEEVASKNVSNVIDIIVIQAKKLDRYNPLKAAITAKSEGICPICDKKMEEISIASNRKALFCKEHNLTLPISE